jgi:hypothetical protein
MGGDHKQYYRVAKEITRLFENPAVPEAIDICRRYKLDVLVVTDTDLDLRKPSGVRKDFSLRDSPATAVLQASGNIMPRRSKC